MEYPKEYFQIFLYHTQSLCRKGCQDFEADVLNRTFQNFGLHYKLCLIFSQRKCIYLDEALPYADIRQEYKEIFYNQGLCLSYCHAMEFFRYCKCLPASNKNIMPSKIKKINLLKRKYMKLFFSFQIFLKISKFVL